MKPAVPFSRELFDDIIERLASGETLSSICRSEGYPHRSTFHDWRELGEDLEKAYLNAKRDGHDAIAEECKQIADTPMEGIEEKYEPVEIPNDDPELPPLTEFRLVERRVGDMLGHRKLQIETRLKLLSKWDSGRYGDKLALAGDKDQPLTIIIRDV